MLTKTSRTALLRAHRVIGNTVASTRCRWRKNLVAATSGSANGAQPAGLVLAWFRRLALALLYGVLGVLLLAGQQASAMYDPSNYRASNPAYPLTYTPTQKAAQLVAGTNMMNALIAAANAGATNYTIAPGVYRINGGYYTLNNLQQNFTINCSNVEMWLVADTNKNSLNWLHINNCQNVSVLGPITFDSDNRIICQGTVTGWNTNNGTINLQIMSGYNPTNFWAGAMCWHYDTNGVCLTRPSVSASTNYVPADLTQVKVTVGTSYFNEPGKLLHLGDLLLARCWYASELEPVLLLGNCQKVILSGIISYDGGLWWNGSANTLLMTNCSNYREPNSNELGGGEEIWNMSPNILVYDGCNNGPGWDDAINAGGAGIHWVCGQPSSRVVLLHDQPAVGEMMTFYHGENWQAEGQARVVGPPVLVTNPLQSSNAITAVNNWMNFWGQRWRLATNQSIYAVTLDRDLPVTLCAIADRPGLHDQSVVVRNCYFCDMNAQEILLRAYNTVLIESNLVERGDSFGVNCTATRYWWEGPAPHNITLRNNRFNNVPSASGYRPEEVWDTDAVLIGEDADGSPVQQVMGSVTITGNVFSNSLVHDISVLNCYNVNISSNVSFSAQPQPVGVVQYGQIVNSSIYVAACSNVFLQGNQLLNPSPTCPNAVKVGPYVSGVSGSDVATAVTFANNPSQGYPSGWNAASNWATVQLTSPLLMAQAIYSFEGNTLDTSGNGRDGVVQGAVGGVTYAAGKIGQAAQINGGSIVVPCSIGLTNFTVSLWIKTTNSAGGPPWYVGGHVLNGDAGGGTEDFGLAVCGDKFDLGIGNPDTDLQSSKVITDGVWHYCVAEWNVVSGAMTIYVDGVLSGSKTGPTGPRWAAKNGLDINLNGAVDDLQLYNYLLTATEISRLYNLQVPLVPATPTGLVATAGNAQVTLNWNAPSAASGFNLYRSWSSGGSYALIATNVNAVSYTETGLTNGTTYYFEVAAINSGTASANSTSVNATPQAITEPAAPGSLIANTVSTNQIGLGWVDNSGGTAGFQIQRSYDGVSFYVVGNVGAGVSNFTDSGLLTGATYYYRVLAVVGSVSSPACVILAVTTLPLPPTGLTATAGDGEVDLSWTASYGAAAYNVNRSTGSGGPYTVVTSGLTGTSYIDTAVTNGVTCYYVVTATAGNAISVNSGQASATPMVVVPVAYYAFSGNVLDTSGNHYNGVNGGVTFVTGKVGQGASFDGRTAYVTIPKSIGVAGSGFTIAFWIKTTDTGGGNQWYQGHGLVDGEQGGVTTDFGTALVGGNFALGIGQPDTTLTSVKFINDGNWHHVAGTWNQMTGAMQVYVDGSLDNSCAGPTGARASPPNLIIGKTPDSAQYFNGVLDEVRLYTNVLTATEIGLLAELPPNAPTGLAAVAGVGQVALSWYAVPDATGYNLKRGVVSGGPYTNIVNATSSLNHTNNGLNNGQTYYYVVTALNANGEGAFSAEASATPYAPPTLTIILSAGSLNLSWPGWAGTFSVYQATNLTPPTLWLPVTNAVSSNNGQFNLTVPIDSGFQFFNLTSP